jgi:hypothetical protein
MEATVENRLRVRRDRWFFVSFACLAALVVAYGFCHTVGGNLLRAAIPRPPILGIHAFVFFAWSLLFIVQTTLIRTRHVRWHRTLGGAGMLMGAAMPVIGVATSLRMARFDLDHGIYDTAESAAFLSIPFNDMMFFTGAVAFARFPFITITALKWYAGVDTLLALAVAWDIWDRGRLHRAYAISLPLVVSGQVAAMWLYLARPAWWVQFAGHLF